MLNVKSVDNILEHIKSVEENVLSLSRESLLKMSQYIETNNLEVDEDISTALQYQDIITQQLDATLEATDSIRKSIDESIYKNKIDDLDEKINNILAQAKDKKDRFSGKTSGNEEFEEIEFF